MIWGKPTIFGNIHIETKKSRRNHPFFQLTWGSLENQNPPHFSRGNTSSWLIHAGIFPSSHVSFRGVGTQASRPRGCEMLGSLNPMGFGSLQATCPPMTCLDDFQKQYTQILGRKWVVRNKWIWNWWFPKGISSSSSGILRSSHLL